MIANCIIWFVALGGLFIFHQAVGGKL